MLGRAIGAACLGVSGWAIALAAQQAQAQQTGSQTFTAQRSEVVRPAELEMAPQQQSTVLQADSTEELLRQVPVQRRFTTAQVRAEPVIQLQQGTADLRPVLGNQDAPVNVAQRLRTSPQLATVQGENFELAEIPEGIVVRQFIAYQLNSGACTNAAQRRAVSAQGVQCFTRISDAQRNRALASPRNSARFVADRSERQQIRADGLTARADQRAQIDADIVQLRGYLSDPARRTEIVQQVGTAEANRLANLSDEDLEYEMLNRAEVEIEEVMFVPNIEAQDLQIQARPSFGQVAARPSGTYQMARISQTRDARDAQLFTSSVSPQASSLPPAHRRGPDQIRDVPGPLVGSTDFRAPQQLDISENIAIDREIFLTGFTLGRQHEWRRRVSLTIAWCLLGCKRTYYVEPYAGFSYGFGLRFPVRMQGTYQYRHQLGQERASFVPDFEPINGNSQQYSRAGIANSQLFSGQELVAEARAYTGVLYKLPHGRQGNFSLVDVGVNLTESLPTPFRNGQFEPPAPGETTPPVVRIFDSIDLLRNRANFGVVGAQVHPAVRLELFSDGLSFVLRDHVAGSNRVMNTPGNAYPLEVNDNRYSRFSVSDPVYNLGFQLTPGLVGRAFVDITVWSNHWDWPVWFPQLTVQLPPGGVNFSCHAGTVCGHQYKLRADHWSTRPRRANPNTEPTRANPNTEPTRANPGG
ncbi:MAG: hypothetical protein ABJP48_11245 [Erythrobacter sp.]